MTILPKKYEQELKDYRDSQNKDRLHQATLKEVKEVKDSELQAKIKLGREVTRLQNKHHNFMLDDQMKMIKRELIAMINERKGE